MILVDINNKDKDGKSIGFFDDEPKVNDDFMVVYSNGSISYSEYNAKECVVKQSPSIPIKVDNNICNNNFFGSVSISSMMLWHLTYVLNQDDFLLFMRLSRNIEITLDIQYFKNIDKSPMSIKEMSNFLNIQINDCSGFITRLIDKNIVKTKYCTHKMKAMQIYIINPYVFNDENYPINDEDNEYFIDDDSTNLDDYFPKYFFPKTNNTSNKSTYNPERNSVEYKQWRKDVFERDNYICQCCDTIGGKLNAHHIENFADNPDIRTDIDNGITMCSKCHAIKEVGSFHNIFGARGNTKEQLQEYINNKRKELGLPPKII